jgi:hypothetical protein
LGRDWFDLISIPIAPPPQKNTTAPTGGRYESFCFSVCKNVPVDFIPLERTIIFLRAVSAIYGRKEFSTVCLPQGKDLAGAGRGYLVNLGLRPVVPK